VVTRYETSCFDGQYITGDVTAEYLSIIEARRNSGLSLSQNVSSTQLDLNLVAVD
jgi:amidophosphoribosyltransferase